MVAKANSYLLSASAVFGALAAILTLLPLSFPFPLIPYLKFDLAEIPAFMAFFLFGPLPGLITSIVYWMVLNLVGSFVPIGPFLKFLAVVSSLAGIALGSWMFEKFARSEAVLLSLTTCFSMVVRIIVLTAANYVVVWTLFPSFLDFAAKSLNRVLGWSFSSNIEALLFVLALTAIFNALHTLLSILPSYAIAGYVLTRVSSSRMSWHWTRGVLYRKRIGGT